MDVGKKGIRISSMLRQISPDVRDLPRTPSAAATLEYPASMRSTAAPSDVDSALDKVHKDRAHELTGAEVFALEAIVMPQNRPVAFIRDISGVPSYDDIGVPWTGLNAAPLKQEISKLLPSIGRIELPLSPILPYAGTGFVVGDGLLMTNRHVAQLFSSGLGLSIKYTPGSSAIDFKRQIDTRPDDRSAYLEVAEVVM